MTDNKAFQNHDLEMAAVQGQPMNMAPQGYPVLLQPQGQQPMMNVPQPTLMQQQQYGMMQPGVMQQPQMMATGMVQQPQVVVVAANQPYMGDPAMQCKIEGC